MSCLGTGRKCAFGAKIEEVSEILANFHVKMHKAPRMVSGPAPEAGHGGAPQGLIRRTRLLGRARGGRGLLAARAGRVSEGRAAAGQSAAGSARVRQKIPLENDKTQKKQSATGSLKSCEQAAGARIPQSPWGNAGRVPKMAVLHHRERARLVLRNILGSKTPVGNRLLAEGAKPERGGGGSTTGARLRPGP